MKTRLITAFIGSLAMGIAFAATAGPRGGWDQCAEACMDSYFSCVLNGVGTEQQCYMHYVNCVGRCGVG